MHVQVLPRMTLMFCAFDAAPLILRLHGTATVVHQGDRESNTLIQMFGALPAPRQIFDVAIDLVLTSCGMTVPEFGYRGERTQWVDWATTRGVEGIREYWREKNQRSLDGLPTHIVEKSGVPEAGDA